MTVIVDNAEDVDHNPLVISSMLICPNGHVFEPVLSVAKGQYSLDVLWCGICPVAHRVQFTVDSKVQRQEDNVVSTDQVVFFLLAIEAYSAKKKDDSDLPQFLRECSRKLRDLPV